MSQVRKSARSTEYRYDHPRPAVTVDIVLLWTSQGRTEVLLIKRRRDPFESAWALPGGFVDEDEGLEDAARRELKEETGVERVRLEQVGAFGDPGRDPRGHTVSIAFVGVLARKPNTRAADDAAEAKWHPVLHPPPLAFDHKKILRAALKRAALKR